jgi:hypothetical protein
MRDSRMLHPPPGRATLLRGGISRHFTFRTKPVRSVLAQTVFCITVPRRKQLPRLNKRAYSYSEGPTRLMSNPALKQSTYIPTVDRWRALSIGLVTLHLSPVQSCHSPLPARLVRAALVFSQLHHAVPIPAHSPVALHWYTRHLGRFRWKSISTYYFQVCLSSSEGYAFGI